MRSRIRMAITARLAKWAHRVINGRIYHWQTIGGDTDPYMIRWIVFKNRWLKIYLHLILRSDSDTDEVLHDHPGNNVSFILEGGYLEWTPAHWVQNPPHEFVGSDMVHHDYWPINRQLKMRHREPGDLVFRRAAMPHRIELDRSAVIHSTHDLAVVVKGPEVPAISLFVMTGDVREWGFHCPRGWQHWKEYTNFARDGNSGTVGRGCGDEREN